MGKKYGKASRDAHGCFFHVQQEAPVHHQDYHTPGLILIRVFSGLTDFFIPSDRLILSQYHLLSNYQCIDHGNLERR